MRRRWHGNQPPGRLSTGQIREIQPAAGAGADELDEPDEPASEVDDEEDVDEDEEVSPPLEVALRSLRLSVR